MMMHERTATRRILLVDDEEDVLEAVRMLLEDEGYQVTASRTGAELDRLAALPERPDLIVLDMLLAGKDGRDLVRALKANAVTRTVPTLMFSAHPAAREECLSAGADAFLAKPFSLDEMLSAVEGLLPPQD